MNGIPNPNNPNKNKTNEVTPNPSLHSADAAQDFIRKAAQSGMPVTSYDAGVGSALSGTEQGRNVLKTAGNYTPNLNANGTGTAKDAKNNNNQSLLTQISGMMGQFSAPYEGLLRDMLAAPSSYNPRSEAERRAAAEAKAETRITPLLAAIQGKRGKEQASYETGKAEIAAAYAGLPDKFKQALANIEEQATESAIARGMGRSGVVDWTREKMARPVTAQYNQAMTEQAAKLAGLTNNFNASMSDINNQEASISGGRGALIDALMSDLYAQDMGLGLQSEASKWNQGMGLANLANSANQGQQSMLSALIPLLLYG